MANLNGFDANQHEPSGFDVLPAGDYDVVIVASEMKPTKAGTGSFLYLKLQVLTGPYQNKPLFDRLNLDNPSATAVTIAKGTLSAICRAVGVMTPKDSAELHNKPLKATVRVTKDGEGNPSNEIKGYKSRHVGADSPPPTPPAPTGIAPPLNTGATVGGEARNPF